MKQMTLKSGLLIVALASALFAMAACTGNVPSYSATVTGNGTSLSSNTTGTVVTGLFTFTITPGGITRDFSNNIAGGMDTLSVFTTDPDCSDLANPVCFRGQQATHLTAQCLTVIDDKAWFAGLVTSVTPDPRISDPENIQNQLVAADGRLATLGKLYHTPDGGPDKRGLFSTYTWSLIEGVDNPIAPIGKVSSSNPLVTGLSPGFPISNVCDLQDKAQGSNADFVLECKNPGDPDCDLSHIAALQCTHTVSGNIRTTTCPTYDDNTFKTLIAPYVAATQIRWLFPDDVTPIPDEPGVQPAPNTVEALLNPPQKSIYSLAKVTRTLSSGAITITRIPGP